MGIDIYSRWKNMTDAEKEGQYTGFSVTSGDVGYLREAYHGEPYATKYFVSEAFSAPDGEVKIPAHILRSRLPETLRIAAERNNKLYEGDNMRDVLKAFIDFVELCEAKEEETGESPTITASY